MYEQLRVKVESAWEDKRLLKDGQTIKAIRDVVELLDLGKTRIADPVLTVIPHKYKISEEEFALMKELFLL